MARRYAYDALMLLDDGAAAHTSSGIGQVSSANKILDLGGALSRSDLGIVGAIGRLDAVAVVDLEAITASNSDDVYNVCIMGANNSDGSKPVVLGELTLGYGTLIPNGTHSSNGVADGSGSDTVAPARFEILFCNEQGGIIYEYVYLYIVVAGTSKSIQFNNVYVAPLPKE